MSSGCKTLLNKFLFLNPKKRFTLEQIMKDEWINQHGEELRPHIEPEVDPNDTLVPLENMLDIERNDKKEETNIVASDAFRKNSKRKGCKILWIGGSKQILYSCGAHHEGSYWCIVISINIFSSKHSFLVRFPTNSHSSKSIKNITSKDLYGNFS